MPDDPNTGDTFGGPPPWQEPDDVSQSLSGDTDDVEPTAEADHRIDVSSPSEPTSMQVEVFSGPADTLTLADAPDPISLVVLDTAKHANVRVTVDDNVIRRYGGGYFGKGRDRWLVTYTA